MNLIGRNTDLIDKLKDNLSLVSSSVKRINIFSDNEYSVCIEIDFDLLYSRDQKVTLRFLNVKEYSFYHNSNSTFYNVESYKLFISDESVYLSLDPYDEFDEIDVNDKDFILSEHVEGYFVQQICG